VSEDPDLPDVQALQAGDEAALDRLMSRHQKPLLAFLYQMTGHASDAEELAQETFVRVYFNIRNFHPRGRFAAWLYQIARNLARDYFRRRVARERRLAEVQEKSEAETALSHDGEDHRIDQLREALLRLPPALRECLVLTAIEGLSHQEAGRLLGISTKAVESRAYRARRLLMKKLRFFEG